MCVSPLEGALRSSTGWNALCLAERSGLWLWQSHTRADTAVAPLCDNCPAASREISRQSGSKICYMKLFWLSTESGDKWEYSSTEFCLDIFRDTYSEKRGTLALCDGIIAVDYEHYLIVCKALELCCVQSIELLGVVGHSEWGGLQWRQVTWWGGYRERRVWGSSPHQAGAESNPTETRLSKKTQTIVSNRKINVWI